MSLKRLLTTTALVMALAAPTAGAFAQPATAPAPSTPPAAAAPHAAVPAPTVTTATATTAAARHMRDDQMRASKLIGSSLYDSSDQKLGSIADLIVDRDGKIADVVVGLGGDKHVAVPMADLKRGKDNHLVLNKTKDELGKMASFDLNYDAARSGSSTRK